MIQEIDIQPADRVVFIHIPKTAGITFSTFLHPLLAQLPWCPVIVPENLVEIPYSKILQYKLFTGHFRYRLLERIFPSGFISLTFLREPVSRTISHYKYLLRQETFGIHPWGDAELNQIKNMTLEEYVSNEQLHLAVDIVNLQTGFLGGFESPQELMFDSTETVASIAERLRALSARINTKPTSLAERRPIGPENLKIAKKRLEQVGFFGLTERFQDSLFLLCFIFGWPPILDALRLNHRPDAETGSTIDSDTLKQIQNKVALDLELYQFAQELFEQRFNEMTQLLLERYTNHATEMNQPRSKELIYTLLQKHYEARRNQRNQTVLKNIGRIYLHRPSLHAEGSFGWHIAETFPEDGPAAWSGPGRESGFDLPCPRGGNLQVSFRILMALEHDSIKNLSLTINNVIIRLQCKTDARGAFIFTGDVPPQAVTGPFLHLVFSVPRTIAPCDITPDNKDARQLGILLNWVKLECLS